jgi:hypothetical protein
VALTRPVFNVAAYQHAHDLVDRSVRDVSIERKWQKPKNESKPG